MSNTEVRTRSSSHVTLINVIEVPAESIDQFVSDWKTDKDFMISRPGFIDGTLYRSLQSDVRFRFVNVARWEREDDWKAAIEAGEKHRAGKGIDRQLDWKNLGIKLFPVIYREEMRY